MCIWNHFRLTREDGLIGPAFAGLLFHRSSLARTYRARWTPALPRASQFRAGFMIRLGGKRLASSGSMRKRSPPLWSREGIDNSGVTCNQKCYVLDFISG